MKNFFKTFFFVILAITVVFVLAMISGQYILPKFYNDSAKNISTSAVGEKLIDKKAPFFDLPDVSSNRVKLTQFLNTPTVIVFWATWNKDSEDQIKILDDYLASQNEQKNFVSVLTVNSQEELSVVKSFIRRGGYNVPVVLDTYGDVSESYNIKNLPTIYFIDKDGVVRDIYTGILNQNTLVDKIEKIL